MRRTQTGAPNAKYRVWEPTLSRRRLLAQTAGLTVAGIVPSYVLGGTGRIPPSEQLHVAVIGTGGQGITNIKTLLTHPDVKITAICDPGAGRH